MQEKGIWSAQVPDDTQDMHCPQVFIYHQQTCKASWCQEAQTFFLMGSLRASHIVIFKLCKKP